MMESLISKENFDMVFMLLFYAANILFIALFYGKWVTRRN